MSDIASALQQSRRIIEAELAQARAELSALDERREALQELIGQAEAALGPPAPSGAEPRMTLHDALVLVLRENGDTPMTARDLTDAINDRGLYSKRDGTPVEINQVHARTNNYGEIFEKEGPLIQLRTLPPALVGLPPGIELFRDNDAGFFAWQDGNHDGYFVNTERRPRPNYLVLHRSGCSHFDGNPGTQWTKNYVKLCSPGRRGLEEWAAGQAGGEVTLCRTCFGNHSADQ